MNLLKGPKVAQLPNLIPVLSMVMWLTYLNVELPLLGPLSVSPIASCIKQVNSNKLFIKIFLLWILKLHKTIRMGNWATLGTFSEFMFDCIVAAIKQKCCTHQKNSCYYYYTSSASAQKPKISLFAYPNWLAIRPHVSNLCSPWESYSTTKPLLFVRPMWRLFRFW